MRLQVLRWLSAVILSLSAGPILAATFSIEPPHPTPSDLVRLRLDIETCDATLAVPTVDVQARTVLVQVSTPDACDLSNPEHTTTPRFVDIGYLPAGVYQVDFRTCPFGPPPAPPCFIFRSEVLRVRSASTGRVVVPALGMASLAMLGVIALVFGAFVIARDDA